uniref:Uncharacterized protein n=1 Tax=Arundo donax TaxID=35708 RepID=A0A0A9B107_ARUDO
MPSGVVPEPPALAGSLDATRSPDWRPGPLPSS